MKQKRNSAVRCEDGFGCDRIAQERCMTRIQPLRSMGLKHLKSTTAESASLEIERRDYVMELHWCPEHYGHDLPFGNWHCSVKERRGKGYVKATGHGETMRGAIVMALTDIEWGERKHPNSSSKQ